MKFTDKIKTIIFSKFYLKKLSKSVAFHGIQKPICILSFDCDTPKDAIASIKLCKELKKIDIPAVFAVPAETLLENIKEYKEVLENGFEFINHGFAKHAVHDPKTNRFIPQTFYNEMSSEEVQNDIKKAHLTIIKKLGIHPKGFRAPHFGCYQKEEQLQNIYNTLREEGYTFSTTTTPDKALENGSLYNEKGIWEFPVSGSKSFPYRILDSWGYFASPKSSKNGIEKYSKHFKKTVDFFVKNNLPTIINFYADPAHIFDKIEFFNCIKYAEQRGVLFSTYTDIIKIKTKIKSTCVGLLE